MLPIFEESKLRAALDMVERQGRKIVIQPETAFPFQFMALGLEHAAHFIQAEPQRLLHQSLARLRRPAGHAAVIGRDDDVKPLQAMPTTGCPFPIREPLRDGPLVRHRAQFLCGPRRCWRRQSQLRLCVADHVSCRLKVACFRIRVPSCPFVVTPRLTRCSSSSSQWPPVDSRSVPWPASAERTSR